jgi:hypothetical protein
MAHLLSCPVCIQREVAEYLMPTRASLHPEYWIDDINLIGRIWLVQYIPPVHEILIFINITINPPVLIRSLH